MQHKKTFAGIVAGLLAGKFSRSSPAYGQNPSQAGSPGGAPPVATASGGRDT